MCSRRARSRARTNEHQRETPVRASINLGRWFGVPIGLHYSWFVIAWLITLSLSGQFAALHRFSTQTVWALSTATAVLFFLSIVLHELAHAWVARLSGIQVRGITLFALGGIAQIESEATRAGKEFRMAIAGPAASVAIGLVCRLLAAAAGFAAPAAWRAGFAAMLGWLAYINVALAGFNLIPGFPLDGGRILRSIVWARTGDAHRATRTAARAGMVVGVLFIALGALSLFAQNDAGGLWIALIGWFLLEGARGYNLQAQLSTTLTNVRVADVMAPECATVDENMTVRRFVEEQLTRIAARCFAVNHGNDVVGLIAADDVKRVTRDRWTGTTVAQAMRPLGTLHPVTPDSSAGEALTVMGRENLDELPVMSDGHFQGIVTRSNLLRLLQARRELEA